MLLWVWKTFADYVRYCYFHYTLITTVAMLEPIERYVFNTCVILFISLFIYTTMVYLPGHLMMMCNFLMHVSGIRPYEMHAEAVSS